MFSNQGHPQRSYYAATANPHGTWPRLTESIRADVRHKGQGRIRAECFWAMRENSLKGWFGQIDKPALVLWGMEDNTVPLRDASIVAREWPAADLRVIPNSGHWPQFETPDVVKKYINGFLGRPTKLIKLDFDD